MPKTGRADIQVTKNDQHIGPRTIQLDMIAQYGDTTRKMLSRDEAIDLARALLTAAEMPSPYAF